jgi:hypothetical protein
MRFTPTAFLGSQTGNLNLIGGVTGSFTSGGVNYAFNKFTSSAELIIPSNIDATILVVAGGASGGQSGGGGGGVLYTETRLYKGTYNVSVGLGGIGGNAGASSSISNTGFKYEALGGGSVTLGNSGKPTEFAAGASLSCGGTNSPGGGGGSARVSGSDASCVPQATGGNGFNGLTYNMDGTSSVYGSGGGGRGRATAGAGNTAGSSGLNAGAGGSFTQVAQDAVAGFGGGGGGAYATVGKGGSGVVIIRYTLT